MNLRYPSFLLILSLLFTFNSANAQNQATPAADSSSTIPDTLLFKIQTAQSTVNQIDAVNEKTADVKRIRKEFSSLNGDLDPVKTDLQDTASTIDKKSLQSYELLLKDAQNKLQKWQEDLSKRNAELQKWSKQIITLSDDSLMTVSADDTTARALYSGQVSALRLRLQRSGAEVNLRLDTVSRLLADVAAANALVTDLQNNTTERLRNTGMNEVRRESPYIWSAPSTSLESSIGELLRTTYQGQNKILAYFIRSTWDNRTLLLLTGLIFFLWIRKNFQKASDPAAHKLIGDLSYEHIRPVPIFVTLVMMLLVVPLFEPDAPSFYIEMIQFVLLVILSLRFWTRLDKPDLRLWFVAVGLHIVIVSASAMINDALWMRLVLMLINVGSVYYGIIAYRRYREATLTTRFVRMVAFIYLGFNIMAVLFNVFGRITLAKVFSITAIIGLTQTIGLLIFVQICMEAMDLQMKVSSCSQGIFSRINTGKASMSFRKFFTWLSIALWWIVFLVNLGIANGLLDLLSVVLAKGRVFGSIKFSFGNILFFALIVYVTNVLQKYIGLLFGDSKMKFEEKVEHKSSKLALIRLIIILLGVLMAMAASGVPMDKLTVVLGAFGVGIGLGMQNIINNFVSGIILIFEKPFRIGDYVELADKKGKVQDIGIRSSRMLTAQGSDVIIPNGDLLSGRLVNWTLTNDYIKTELTFKITTLDNLDIVSKIVEEELLKLKTSTVGKLKPEILVNAIGADSIELKVLVWINNIYIEAGFKSDLFKLLLPRFNEAGIKLL
ncbi:mechanosensitive ion channel [Pedobacter sp. MC2016-15]|uniref:mechanosensitive ion channel domain-containing protein n=1 Tax=Pedobacter sp. MC2016-15 TaxID=2994473 RepID=UPI002246CDBA|nr:mechanosensitive ion channel domain-containing protein [Pedobacter sp. MC2016-15]MCX2478279.1 mechanosensitive ion channel [Pedobacter sp. MC2016-15]